MIKKILPLVVILTNLASISAQAQITPSPVNQDSRVPWSEVVNDPFDGKIVYDKDFGSNHATVSSWTRNYIKLSYFQREQEIVSYRNVRRTRQVWRKDKYVEEVYWEREPIYRSYWLSDSPEQILFAIDGVVYRYDGDVVSDELASALANAPEGNMRIRLVWQNQRTQDVMIGGGTVKAWKEVYGN
ncbi:hypothetical protein IQ215_05740 [Cyanobacterium stanieri LEGE 03274]|uniref:DUF3857 domain-containing protein n=1 Tax=Cyanobacterium stanieri LEGE 03274 TaxID=1828756 RepID=A0ABR9V2S0_9CHRO|nr:hypothetical protein [Cyanobacterium stanieri]MBE9222195.1 hypothetical protein [Cyanobacterium stanieri LEGE 03274]